MEECKVVVLIPTKNEDWILERFLEVTSIFADFIIIADQQSCDSTQEIALKYPKAVFVKNPQTDYDEGSRQILLIEKARELVKGKKLLIAIDADEIITYDSLFAKEWDTLKNLEIGTRIYMKKPDLLSDVTKYLDYPDHFLIGYLDDGRAHVGKKFHSERLPQSERNYFCKEIRFMHLALVRDKEYNSRQRLYSIMENINETDSLQIRYRKYSRLFQKIARNHLVKTIPHAWMAGYEQLGIDFTHFLSSENNNFNRQILQKFEIYGMQRFWWDDIWYVDYDSIKVIFPEINIPKINKPPLYVSILRKALINILNILVKTKNVVGR